MSLGNVVLLVQCLCAGCMWVVQKRVLATIPSAVLVTACSYAIAAVFTVAATVCVFGVGDPRIYVDSAIGWGGILYAALFATVATYVAMAWANRWASPSTVTISLALQPQFVAIAAVSAQRLSSWAGVGDSVQGSGWPPMQAQERATALLLRP